MYASSSWIVGSTWSTIPRLVPRARRIGESPSQPSSRARTGIASRGATRVVVASIPNTPVHVSTKRGRGTSGSFDADRGAVASRTT
jgi:hypothetical protein